MTDEVTPLPPARAREFAEWLRRNNVRDLDHPDSHYDYRGAFLAGVGRGSGAGHFPDTFKQHGHPTFSVESQYSRGPGDGGRWDGDIFIPQNTMTDQDPRFLPGDRPVPYGMTAGVRQLLPGVNDQDPRAIEGRYSLGGYPPSIGGKWVRPEDIDLDHPNEPKPDVIDLDETGPAPAPAGVPAPSGPTSGWRVKNAKGDVVATIGANPKAGQDYQRLQVENIGQSLLGQAVSPEEKVAAQRAAAFGLSLVGTMGVDKIQQAIVHRYDQDVGNSLKSSLQEMRSKNRGAGKGGGGALGPTKAEKFENQVNLEDSKLVESIVNNEQQASKLASLRDYENDLERLEQMISSPNALSQRGAIAEYLKTLTGKQSTDVERQQIFGAAGKLSELENNLALWSPTDASLTKAYIEQFKKNIATLRSSVRARKNQIGREAADRLVHQPRFMGKDSATKNALRSYGQGVVTGEYGDSGGVDEDLLK